MKQIVMSQGRKITTPWLNADEAAAYCGWARTTFLQRAGNYHLPCSRCARSVRYFAPVIDTWLQDMKFKDGDHGKTKKMDPGM